MKKSLLWLLNMAAALSVFTFSTGASAQIGSLSSDLVFTPVTPCRIMDTRNAGSISGILVAGTTRTFNGNSSVSNYTNQGGLLATCGLPFVTDVAAIVLNFTVVTPAAAGYITVFPGDAAQPLAATVNFTVGSVVGNNATLKISQADANGQFKIYSTTNTHVVADVVGYYVKPVATALACTQVYGVTVSVPANGEISAGTLTCTAGYTPVSLLISSSGGVVMLDSYIDLNTGSFFMRNLTGGALNATGKMNCCRIPGR